MKFDLDSHFDPINQDRRGYYYRIEKASSQDPEKAGELIEPDKQVLLHSGKKVLEMILDEEKGWPDAIVFPDTSARPLYYLFRPGLKAAAEARGKPMPLVFFFKTNNPRQDDELGVAARLFPDWNTATFEHDILEDIAAGQGMYENKMEYEREALIKRFHEEEPTLKKLRASSLLTYADRTKEIKSTLESHDPERAGQSEDKIIVIDDYLDNGSAVTTLRKAIGGTDIDFYALLTSQEEPAEQLGVSYGMIDPYPRDSWNLATPGFEYRNNTIKRTALGVKKEFDESPHTSVDPGSRVRDRIKLRSEMNELGLVLANEILKKPEPADDGYTDEEREEIALREIRELMKTYYEAPWK